MKLFGLDFPERKRPVCETCAEPMTLTGRMPDFKRQARDTKRKCSNVMPAGAKSPLQSRSTSDVEASAE